MSPSRTQEIALATALVVLIAYALALLAG